MPVCLLLAFSGTPAAANPRRPSPQEPGAAALPQLQQSGSIPGDADDMVQLGPLESDIAQGDCALAIPGLGKYLKLHPTSSRAHYDLGYAFFRTHQIGGAVKELSKSLELNTNNAQAHKILGLVCTFVGRYDLAEVELRAAARLEPNSAEIHYWLGRIYYTRDVYPLAVQEFKTAVQLNPSYMNAYTNLGLVMETLGKNEEAIRYYTVAVRLDQAQHPKSPWPYEYLSAHYDRMHDPATAIRYAQETLSIDPRCDLAYYDLAKAYEMQRDWKQSETAAQSAIAINSRTPEYFYVLSIALRKLGKIDESDAALKQFQAIHKDQTSAERAWEKANHEPEFRNGPAASGDEP